MNCKNHNEIEAVAVCVECAKPLCDECLVEISGKSYCQECVDYIAKPKTTSQNDSIISDESSKDSKSNNNKFFTDLKSNIRSKSLEVKKQVDGYLEDKNLDEELNRVEKEIKKTVSSIEKDIKKRRDSYSKDPIHEIKRAKELLDMGAITQEEFDAIKKKYIKQLTPKE